MLDEESFGVKVKVMVPISSLAFQSKSWVKMGLNILAEFLRKNEFRGFNRVRPLFLAKCYSCGKLFLSMHLRKFKNNFCKD